MGIDQLTADCLGLSAEFQVTMNHHRSSIGSDRGPQGRSRAEARHLNSTSEPYLQRLVDELHRTEPRPERVYELRVIANDAFVGCNHYVLLCSDQRVVYAEGGSNGGLRTFVPFPHGVLDVQNKLLKAAAELEMGPPPVLIWPRLAGDDDVLDVGVRQVMGGPSPHFQRLLERASRGERADIFLEAPFAGARRAGAPHVAGAPVGAPAGAPAGGPAVALPGWYADPSGRHQHRWFDGSAWTANAADAGVPVQDPL